MKQHNTGDNSCYTITMPAVTVDQLLKAMSPLLDKSGGMKDTEAASRIVSLMKDATKLLVKCVYANICISTVSEEVLLKFISTGGWNVLNKWLQEAKEEEDNTAFVVELLRVYQKLPVSVDDLKKDNTARFIKGLTKHKDEDVQSLSSSLVDSWMQKVKGKSNHDSENDKLKKKKKKDKEREKDKEKEKDVEKEKDKHRHKKDSSHHHTSRSHSHHSSKKDSSSNDKKNSSSVSDVSRKDSTESKGDSSEGVEPRAKHNSSSPPHGKVEPAKEEEDKSRRKPKTARVFTNKFRSVFDEDEPLPPVKKRPAEDLKIPLTLSKKLSCEMKDEPMEKVPRLTIKIPPPDPSVSGSSPTSTSPEMTHGKMKIISLKRAHAHEIHDSNVFMNELTKSSYTHGTIKRRKKHAAATPAAAVAALKPPQVTGLAAKTPLTTAPTTPTTPTTPTISPGLVSPISPKLPPVPSFYRDTLAESQPEPSKEERSPPSLEKMDTSEPDSETPVDEPSVEDSEPPTIEMEPEQTTPHEDMDTEAEIPQGPADGEPVCAEGPENEEELADMQSEERANGKSNKKRVRWADDSCLKQIFYFELDETERENVNRPKTFHELKKQEMRSEGRAMESVKRMTKDNMVEVLPWRRPRPIDNLQPSVEQGCNSIERGIQQAREAGVLQALYFSRQMLPDSPMEPDLESVEPCDTKIIPLVDETSSGEEYEHTYNIDPQSAPYDPAFDISHDLNPMGGGGPNMSKGPVQLPPDINNILASIQQQGIATGGQFLQANSTIMNNVQSILASIMQAGPNTNTEELINNLRLALEPLKNQIPGGPMQGMNQNDPHFQPHGPQRHGLLGNAPPGFNNMMGPRNFGPQGPGNVGGMEGEWNVQGPDMAMRGPMGPGFHRMQGPMQGPGPSMGNNGPVMPGPPRMRNNRRGQERRAVCRHFVSPTGCRFGNTCAFLHPGVNGPPLSH